MESPSKEDQILAAIVALTAKEQPTFNLVEAFSKSAPAVIAAFIIGFSAFALNSYMQLSKLQIAVFSLTEDVEKFTQKPRFSRDDFRAEIAPIMQLVQSHEDEFRARRGWMTRMEPLILKNEIAIIGLDKDLDDLQNNLRRESLKEGGR